MAEAYDPLSFLSCLHCIAGQVAATESGPQVPKVYAPESQAADRLGMAPLCLLIRESSPRLCRAHMLADALAAGQIVLKLEVAFPAPSQLYIPEPAWNELQP